MKMSCACLDRLDKEVYIDTLATKDVPVLMPDQGGSSDEKNVVKLCSSRSMKFLRNLAQGKC